MSREMVNSGIPWIGDIPKEWKIRKLRNLGKFSASGIDKKFVVEEELVHIINYVDVYKNTSKELKKQEYMLVSAPSEKCIEHQVNIGDMIFTPSSETVEDIGVSAVIVEDLPNTAFSYHVLRFQPTNEIYIGYRKYFTNNNYCLSYFSSCATGTIRKTISRDIFKECLVLLPPFQEQQKIASFLDKKCAEVDGMVTLQEKIIEELKAYKQSVITEAVTKGLNLNVPMKESGIEWIGQIPVHWEVKRLKYLCKIQTGNKDTQDADSDGIYPFYVRSPLVERSTTYSFDGEGILMAGDGVGAGRVFHHAFGKYAVHQRVYRLSEIIGINSNYLYYYISNLFNKVMDMGSAQSTVPSVRLPMLTNFNVCIPIVEEQQSIADYLDTKCTEIDNLISIKQQKIEHLKEYKKSIIYEYVTGKKEVED